MTIQSLDNLLSYTEVIPITSKPGLTVFLVKAENQLNLRIHTNGKKYSAPLSTDNFLTAINTAEHLIHRQVNKA